MCKTLSSIDKFLLQKCGVIKVLQINTVAMKRNGMTAIILNYAKHMNKTDMQIDFIAINKMESSLKTEFEGIGKVYELPTRNHNPVKYIVKLAKIIRKEKYNIVHIHGNSSTEAVDLFAAYLGGAKKRIAHSHNTKCEHNTLHRILRPFFNILYTDGLACSEMAGQWLFGKRTFKVLPNAIELKKYKFNEQIRANFREKLDLKNEFAIAHVATLTEPKNHKFMLNVFAVLSVLSLNKKFKMFLIGDGYLKFELKDYVKKLGLENDVIFMGSVQNVNEYLNAMDIMVLPSLYEGFGIVAIEGQVNGLSVCLSANVPTNCNITKLCEFLPLKKDVWVEMICKYEAKENRKELSEKAIEKLKSAGFDIEEQSDVLRRIYEQ